MRATIGLTCILSTILPACSGGDETSASGFTTANTTLPTSLPPPPGTTLGSTSEPGGSEPTTDGETGGPGETGETGVAGESTTRTTEDAEVTGHADVTGETATTGPVEPPAPSCADGLLNQDESDIDCGGATCPKCGTGETCQAPTDCETDSCIMGACTEPSCSDGAKNGDETDVDCGGACMPCGDNLGCVASDDCASQVCTNEVCSPPACGDGVQNGGETAVDCGGGCMGCAEGQACGGDADCLSGFCSAGMCAPKECDDNSGCAQFNSACTIGVCNVQKKCEAQNANEGGACDDGNKCMTGEKCTAGVCGGAVAKDCSAMSGACTLGVCDMGSGNCAAQPANEGNPCNDNNACTVAEVCGGGTCKDPGNPNGYVFYETFANNSAGWSLGTEWGIASAKVSAGHQQGFPDPGSDHTPTGDNGVAGVVIGGNAGTALHDYYFLTSPPVNTAQINGTVWLSFWRWLNSDYPTFMDNHIDVWNGNTWTTIFAGPPAGQLLTENAWTQQAFDVTAYKSAGFQFRIGHKVGAGGVYVVSSWNVDDVMIGPAVCSPP